MTGGAPGTPRNEFGLSGIFNNVRDGLVLVRLPTQEIVLFNRAAADMSGISREDALGKRLTMIFTDAHVGATVRRCSKAPVGVWPGHDQVVLQTRFRGQAEVGEEGVEVHFCRVDPPATAGPLVLLVMRPNSEVQHQRAGRQFARRWSGPKAVEARRVARRAATAKARSKAPARPRAKRTAQAAKPRRRPAPVTKPF